MDIVIDRITSFLYSLYLSIIILALGIINIFESRESKDNGLELFTEE